MKRFPLLLLILILILIAPAVQAQPLQRNSTTTNAVPVLPLSGLMQSGATSGQVAKWNGSDWVPDTDLNTGGSGNFNTNNFGTNLTLFTHDNDPDSTIAPALTIKPLEKRTTPGSGMMVWVIEPPYTNTGFLGRFKLAVTVATNTLGDLRPDITHNYSYNADGADTNEPLWIITRETRWQNVPSRTQLEDWSAFGTPVNVHGTNDYFRYIGFNLVWDTTNRTYVNSDGNITIDSFYFGVPTVGTNAPGNGLPAITFAKSRTNSMLLTLPQQSQISFAANAHPDGQFILDANGENLAGRYQYGMGAFGSPSAAKSNAIVLMPGTALAGQSPAIYLGASNAYAGLRWSHLSNRLEYTSSTSTSLGLGAHTWRPFNDFSKGMKQYYEEFTLSATTGAYTELGYYTNNTQATALLQFDIVGHANNGIQRCVVPLTTADMQATTWKEVLPIVHGMDAAAPRVALDVKGIDLTSAHFRVRQAGSAATALKITITVFTDDDSGGFINTQASTGTGATVVGYYRHAPMTQVLNRVGIGTNNPSDTLQVFGGITGLTITNSGTTDAMVYADANGKFGEAVYANLPAGDDEAYDATGWNADTGFPTKNAVRDKIEALSVGGGLGTGDIDTSAEIAAIVTDETGSGALVFGTSPTFTTPVLGAASGTSLTLSSLTAGRVPFATTAGLLTDDSALRWNNTTKAIELGVGDTTAGRLDFFGDNDGNSSGVIAMLADSPSGEDRMVFTNAGAVAGFLFSGGPIHTEGVTNTGGYTGNHATLTNRFRQPFTQLTTSGDVTNYTIDFAVTVPVNRYIMATGNVYFASLDNLIDGVTKNIIITNVFKASSNITVYMQTNLGWLGPTNGYALGASPMHTNRAYPVTNVLVLSLQSWMTTPQTVMAYGVHSSP